MKRYLIVISIAFTLFGKVCFADSGQAVDRIVAVVGEEIILLSEVLIQVRPALEEIDKSASGSPEIMVQKRKNQIIEEGLGRMIDDALVIQQADEMQISVTTDEIDKLVSNMASEYGLDAATFERVVEEQGMDMMTFRNQKRNQLLRYKVVSLKIRGRINISEAEARQYYNGQVRSVRKTGGFEGAHILIRVAPNARAVEAAKARKKASAIMERISTGESFSQLAREESQDKATAPNGGSLGELKPGVIPGILDRAFLDLEEGELAGPIRTPAGYHIIKLNKREMLGVQPFAEVKDKIMNQLVQEEMMRQEKIWLKELRHRTFIDIRL